MQAILCSAALGFAAVRWTAPADFSAARSSRVAACAAAPSLKEKLLTAIGSDSLATAASLDKQMELNELVLALSSAESTPEPARSTLINGRWDILYSGTPAAGLADSPTRLLALALYSAPLSPSVLAQGLARLPFNAASLGPLSVTISSVEAGQPRVTVDTSVTLLGGAEQKVALRANLSPRSGVAMREAGFTAMRHPCFVAIDSNGSASQLRRFLERRLPRCNGCPVSVHPLKSDAALLKMRRMVEASRRCAPVP